MPRDENNGEDGGAGGSGGGWVSTWWRALVAELLATALLVALGVGSMLPYEEGQATPLVHPAMAFGCVIVGCCVAFGPTSGAHMNPAVTLAALMAGRVGWRAAGAYVVAQVAGALLGFGALWAASPAHALKDGAGCTRLAADVSPAAGAAVEAVLTGTLVLACCALWAAPAGGDAPDHAAPLKLGLLVAGLVFAGGPVTGASLNPARSLAPALLHSVRARLLHSAAGPHAGVWVAHWVYWAGPLAGAALAQLLHRWVLARPAPRDKRRARGEHLPLHAHAHAHAHALDKP